MSAATRPPYQRRVAAHRWLGLLAAAPLMMVGLSDAILVFQDDTDRALNPGLHHAAGPAPRRSPPRSTWCRRRG